MSHLSITGPEKGVLVFSGELNRDTLMHAWNGREKSLTGLHKQHDTLTVDLSDVSSVDTAGLAFLVNLIGTSKKYRLELKISSPPESLLKLAKISDVTSLLPLQ